MFSAYTFNVFSLQQSVKQSVYDPLNKWQLLLSDAPDQSASGSQVKPVIFEWPLLSQFEAAICLTNTRYKRKTQLYNKEVYLVKASFKH